MVQWLRLCAPNTRGLALIPGQGTMSCMLKLRPRAAKKEKETNKDNMLNQDKSTQIK